jgi:hypothetical protein
MSTRVSYQELFLPFRQVLPQSCRARHSLSTSSDITPFRHLPFYTTGTGMSALRTTGLPEYYLSPAGLAASCSRTLGAPRPLTMESQHAQRLPVYKF